MRWLIELRSKRDVLPRFLYNLAVCVLVSAAVLVYGGTEPWRIAILAFITLTVPAGTLVMDVHRLREAGDKV